MKILIVGGGGREHALTWKLARDSPGASLFCAPGNAGTARLATNLPIEADQIEALTAWAREERPDLIVIGPEVPLCLGLSDALTAEGLRVFGPSAAAARLEGSKAFAKEIMTAAGVPTAAAVGFDDHAAARAHVREHGAPVVVKADGLAAGKGVFVCETIEAAERALETIFDAQAFGAAGRRVMVEEFLEGEEASILALVDGEHIVMLAASQDHKRALNGDQGDNTGGMGAYCPAPVVTGSLWPRIENGILRPTIDELARRGIAYKGVLYAGLMMTAVGPRVLEFNCRFGDPETQAVLPRMSSNLTAAMEACIDGCLSPEQVTWCDEACVCVVMASEGYPGAYRKDLPITGIDAAEALEGVSVFHAGTRSQEGRIVTAGGRVLGVTALGGSLRSALERAYRGVETIRFDGAHYRTDIAARAL